MVSILCIVCCLVFAYGVSGESPTPSDDWLVESSTLEKSFTDEEWTPLETIYQLLSLRETNESDWVAYSPETYPLFRKAIKEIAASEEALLAFWKTFNRDPPSKEFFDQVFKVHNRLASEDSSSATEGSQEATTYRLVTTDPRVSEVTDVYTIEDRVTSVDDSGVEYHTGVSHDGDEAVYYTTERPTLETMLADEAIYGNAMSSEDQEDTDEKSKDAYATSFNNMYEATVQDEVSGGEETNDASENEWGNLERRSGVVEEHPSADVHCEGCPLQVGSIRAIPGVHFPNYIDIPLTSFSCADKRVPGFYADLETGCQVFHVCWPHRRESFLCPIGTLFNQAILACDYWYSTNCSLSSLHFDATTLSPKSTTPDYEKPAHSKFPEWTQPSEASTEWFTESYIEKPAEVPDERPHVDLDWFRLDKFLPVKSKVTVYSKHSGEKQGSKWVIKQKRDVLPLVEEFLELTKSVAQKAIRLVPEAKVDDIKPSISKSKLVKFTPAAKLRPCLKIEDIKVKPHKPSPPVEEPQPLSKLDPRFIVKPFVAKKRPVFHVKKEKFVFPEVPVKHVKAKHGERHAPEIVMKALEMAGNVLQRDILDLARQALIGSHVSSMKSKH